MWWLWFSYVCDMHRKSLLYANHEIRTKKCLDTCRQMKFVLTFTVPKAVVSHFDTCHIKTKSAQKMGCDIFHALHDIQ